MTMTYLEYHDEKSAKFWQISVDGNAHTVTFGKIGTTGQSKTKTFDTAEQCQADAEKLIKSKKAKGYSEDGTPVVASEKTSQNSTANKNKQDKTAIFAEFDEIIKNGDLNQVVPFLTAHKDGNVSELKKRLNKARHYYLDWGEYYDENGNRHWGSRGDANHERMLFCFALGLLSASDFNGRWFDCFIQVLRYMDDPKFYTIKDYKNNTYQMVFDVIKHFEFKDVFNALYLELIKQEWSIDYGLLRKLETANLIEHNPQVFARALDHFSLSREQIEECENNVDIYIQKILAFDVASRDLTSLFEYETNICWQGFYGIQDDRLTLQNGEYWLYLMPKYIEQGKLERDWVLQKCIEIQSNLWKQTTKKFYKDLFKSLNPTEQEILSLQDNILMLLQNELKPTVNFALDTLKPFILHQAFNLEEFLTFVSPIMMNGEYKGAIKTLLTQFDKILKLDSNHITLIYPSLCNVLFVNDLALQEKSVKLLVKYANQDTLGDEWESLINHIETVFDSLPNDIQTLLTPLYQGQSKSNKPITENTTQSFLSDITYQYDPVVRYEYFADDKKIALYSEFNDILFNFGQLEYSKNPIDIEIFMASWLHLKTNSQFPEDYLEQVKAVLEKYRNEWFINRPFNVFRAEFLNHIYQTKDEKFTFDYEYRNYKIVYSYQALVQKFVHLNQHNPHLSLLSMPTHSPAFIEPKVLVERLIAYQNANEKIDLTDYAIAIARMPRVDIEPAIALLSEINDELIAESLKCALGLIEPTDTVPSMTQMQLMGVERSQEKIDKLNAEILEREQALEEHKKSAIAKALLNKAKKAIESTLKNFGENYKRTNYQGWRGVFTTVVKTHYPHLELDYQHSQARLFDGVIEHPSIDSEYRYTPIKEYKDHNGSYVGVETGNYEVSFKMKEYFDLSHTSDIYRKVCYDENKNNYFDYFDYFDCEIILLPKYLMPVNQSDYDKFLSSCVFKNGEMYTQLALPIIERLMSEDYPYNAYTQFILVACLFAKDKAVRLAGIDAIIFAINQFKLDPDMFAQHSGQWISHFSAPFSRYVECMSQLSQYEPIYQQVVLILIEKTLIKLEFKDKLPTNFKKYLEVYYLLLSGLNQKADKRVIDKLQSWLEISGAIKTIVGKIGKLS